MGQVGLKGVCVTDSPWCILAAVHLCEYCPGIGGHEAGDPDEADHLPGAANTGPRVQGQRVADGLVPATQIYSLNDFFFETCTSRDRRSFNNKSKYYNKSSCEKKIGFSKSKKSFLPSTFHIVL